MPTDPMTIAIAVAGLGMMGLLVWPRLRRARLWHATITPLASIIGSGFLILGPILTDRFGSYGIVAMVVLCAVGYAFGWAIRYNIARIGDDDGTKAGEGAPDDTAALRRVERISSWALAFAYVISVTYYLNLFGSFFARIFPHPSDSLSRIITTVIYGIILAAGLTRGFSLLERVEQISVSLQLATITALLAALCVYGVQEYSDGTLHYSSAVIGGLPALQLMFGFIITVQGFETSRYLRREYSAADRQHSMKMAQWISTAIYLVYAGLLAISFESGSFTLKETAIIDMMAKISAVLGPLLILAALAAQFSAAVADTGGSGGLVEELTEGRVSPKGAYVGLALVGLGLTWSSSVFQIVSYASRAFALYYALQSGLAFLRARRAHDGSGQNGLRLVGFATLALLGLAAAVFGRSVEGG